VGLFITGVPNMKAKTTAETTRKAQARKPATKTDRKSVAAGRRSRSGRSPTAAPTTTADTMPTTAQRHTSKKARIEPLVRRKGLLI
jgi:hypothetical protein